MDVSAGAVFSSDVAAEPVFSVLLGSVGLTVIDSASPLLDVTGSMIWVEVEMTGEDATLVSTLSVDVAGTAVVSCDV